MGILPAVMLLLREAGYYLKTYATVTLINLSHGNEAVKNAIMENDIVAVLKEHMDSNEKDLVYYTLVLITALSKSDHHRMRLHKPHSIVFCVIELLPSRNSDMEEGLFPTFAETASVIGQLCNSDEILKEVLQHQFGGD